MPRLGLRARSAREGNRVAAAQESREVFTSFAFGDDVDVIRRDARIPRPRFFREDAAHQRRQRSRDRDIRQGDRLGDVIKQKSPAVRSQTRVERFERRLDVRSRARVAENVRANARVEGVTRELHPRVNRRRARRVSRGRVQGSRGRAGGGDCVRVEGTKRAACEARVRRKVVFRVFFPEARRDESRGEKDIEKCIEPTGRAGAWRVDAP